MKHASILEARIKIKKILRITIESITVDKTIC